MTDNLPPIDDEDRQFLHYNPNTDDVVEFVQNYARTALAQAQSCVPAGWKLVPIDPTEAMYVAGDDAVAECKRNKCAPAGDTYRAMLAASPQPQPVQASEPPAPANNYIQSVPDHCDRIVWRGHYHHLPIAQAKPEQAAQPKARTPKQLADDAVEDGEFYFNPRVALTPLPKPIAAPQPKD